MPKKILNVVLVNTVCSQSGCKGSSRIVPDSTTRLNRAERDPGLVTGFLEPLVDPILVDSVRVLVKDEGVWFPSSSESHN